MTTRKEKKAHKKAKREADFHAAHQAAHHSPEHHAHLRHAHHKKARKLKLLMSLITVFIVVVALGTLWKFNSNAHRNLQDALNNLRNTLSKQVATGTNNQLIQSNAGFSVAYNPAFVHAQGQVFPEASTNPSLYDSGNGPVDTYTGSSLNTPRDYSNIGFLTDDNNANSALLNISPVFQMQISTDLQANIFAESKTVYGSNLSDLQLAIKLFAPTAQTTSYNTITPTLTSQTPVTIGGTTYQKVTYKMTDQTFSADSFTKVQYVTVQNGRPYEITIDITPTTEQGDLSLLEGVINNIRYEQPAPGALTGASTSSSVDGIQQEVSGKLLSNVFYTSLPSDNLNLPSALSSTSLTNIAKDQPAVVRVGTIDCFNFNLLLPGGQSAASFTNACAAGVGSGSIVSSDGYISTNGHVVKMTPADALELYLEIANSNEDAGPFNTYFNYLVAAGIATPDQLNALITSAESGDNTAFQTLLNLTASIPYNSYQVTSETRTYAIQLSTEAIKLNINGYNLSFNFDSKVVQAKYVDSNINLSQISGGSVNFNTYSGTDVGLLKIPGSDLPVITLGSFTDTPDGSTITAIGYPGFVDGGLNTTDTHTIPTATQGTVQSIGKEASGPYYLMTATVPMAEGNSGGPALDNAGQEVGLTTYFSQGADPNAGISEESTGAVIRNIADFKALLTQSNVTLDTNSEVTNLWHDAINDFSIAYYKDAVKLTQQVQTLDPNNYLASDFLSSAQQQVADGHDASGPNLVIVIGLVAVGVLIIGGVVVAVLLIQHRKHGHKMGYYGPPPTIGGPGVAPGVQGQPGQPTTTEGSNWQAQAVQGAAQAVPVQPIVQPTIGQQPNAVAPTYAGAPIQPVTPVVSVVEPIVTSPSSEISSPVTPPASVPVTLVTSTDHTFSSTTPPVEVTPPVEPAEEKVEEPASSEVPESPKSQTINVTTPEDTEDGDNARVE